MALELGYFLAMMGSEVHIIEMLPEILMSEERDARRLVQRELSRFMHFHTGHRAREVRKSIGKKVVAMRGKWHR